MRQKDATQTKRERLTVALRDISWSLENSLSVSRIGLRALVLCEKIFRSLFMSIAEDNAITLLVTISSAFLLFR